MELIINNKDFIELTIPESFFIDGGDTARQAMTQKVRSSGGLKISEADRKAAIAATSGLLSVAAIPIGLLSTSAGIVAGAVCTAITYASL